MKSFENKLVVVPVDLSEESDRALKYTLALEFVPEQITVLHVGITFGAAIDPPYIYPVVDATTPSSYERAVLQRYSAFSTTGGHVEVRYGEPGYEIAKFAEDTGAGLIVIPSHGRKGLSHLFLGSVAERVVRYAHCPVLVLRGLSKSMPLAAKSTPVGALS